MIDTIDRYALRWAMCNMAFETVKTNGDIMPQRECWVRYRDVEQVIKSMPTAESEIIRCKDCRFNRMPATSGNADCEKLYGMTDQNGFCSLAERREK